MALQLFQPRLLERQSFLHQPALLLSEITRPFLQGGLFLDSLFCPIKPLGDAKLLTCFLKAVVQTPEAFCANEEEPDVPDPLAVLLLYWTRCTVLRVVF